MSLEGEAMKREWRPTSTLGWWVFSLGLATVVWGIMLPSLPRILRPLREAAAARSILVPIGLLSVFLEIILAITVISAWTVAIWKGERSCLSIVGVVLAIIFGSFWILFALGEVLIAH